MDEMTEETKPKEEQSKLWSLPEAPVSVNFYGVTKTGWNCQFTLRGFDDVALLNRMAEFVKKLEGYQVTPKPVGQQPSTSGNGASKASAPQDENTDPSWCPIHSVTMKRYEKDGRAWYSHKHGDEWCKGK